MTAPLTPTTPQPEIQSPQQQVPPDAVTPPQQPVEEVVPDTLTSAQTMLIMATLLYYSAFKKTIASVNNFNTLDSTLFHIKKIHVEGTGEIDPNIEETSEVEDELAEIIVGLSDKNISTSVADGLLAKCKEIDDDSSKTDAEKDTLKRHLMSEYKTTYSL